MDRKIKNALRLARQFGGPAPMSSQTPPQNSASNPNDNFLIPYLRPGGTMPQMQSPQTQQAPAQMPMNTPPSMAPMNQMPQMGMRPPTPMPTPMPAMQMSGAHPMAMAHGGSVEDALRIANLRLHRDDGGGVEGEVAFAPEEKPDYDRASQFVQEQLNTGEPQLPQMDREAYNNWKYGAANALHAGAYLHPMTAPAMAAYDFGHGAATGNPREMAGAMFGLPSRVAKAIATASFAEQPESEGASPASKLAAVAKDRFAEGGEVDDALRLADFYQRYFRKR